MGNKETMASSFTWMAGHHISFGIKGNYVSDCGVNGYKCKVEQVLLGARLKLATGAHQRGSVQVNECSRVGYNTGCSVVLGSQFIMLTEFTLAGRMLWVFAILLWLALTYTIFTAFTVKEEKPSLDKGITGGWLLAVVATQSIAVLSALIAVDMPQPYKLGINFLALSMWLWGGMLYIWMMSLIFYLALVAWAITFIGLVRSFRPAKLRG